MRLSNTCFHLLHVYGKRLICCRNHRMTSIRPIDVKIKGIAFLVFCGIPLLVLGVGARIIEKCCCPLKNHLSNSQQPLNHHQYTLIDNISALRGDVLKKIFSNLSKEDKCNALIVNKEWSRNLIFGLKEELSPITIIDKIILMIHDSHAEIVDKLKDKRREAKDKIFTTSLSEIYCYFSKLTMSFATILKELEMEELHKIRSYSCKNENIKHKLLDLAIIYKKSEKNKEKHSVFKELLFFLVANDYIEEAIIIFEEWPTYLKYFPISDAADIEYGMDDIEEGLELGDEDRFEGLRDKFFVRLIEVYCMKGDPENAYKLFAGISSDKPQDRLFAKICKAYYAIGDLWNAIYMTSKIRDPQLCEELRKIFTKDLVTVHKMEVKS